MALYIYDKNGGYIAHGSITGYKKGSGSNTSGRKGLKPYKIFDTAILVPESWSKEDVEKQIDEVYEEFEKNLPERLLKFDAQYGNKLNKTSKIARNTSFLESQLDRPRDKFIDITDRSYMKLHQSNRKDHAYVFKEGESEIKDMILEGLEKRGLKRVR